MKTVIPFLMLYLKAGWHPAAVIAGTITGLTFFFWLPIAFFAIQICAILFFLQSLALAFMLYPVDKLLFTMGLSPVRRMALMFAAWIMHLGILAFALAAIYVLAGIKTHDFFPSGLNIYRMREPSFDVILALYLAIPLFFTAVFWVDFQARRLAAMWPLDTALIMIAAYTCLIFTLFKINLVIGLIRADTFNFFHPDPPPTQGFFSFGPQLDLLVLAGILLLLILVLSRFISIYSLLKDSEPA